EAQGLLLASERGSHKYYKLNKNFPTFTELKSIINKTIGAVEILRKALADIPGTKLALLYGSFPQGQEDAESDIDVFVVSDKKPDVFYTLFPALEKKLGREINFTIYSEKEYLRKRKAGDPFLADILTHKYEILSGQL
ncbi:MAG: nucleotidyltransferase domain-containing protein, partial [bacterium]|nr:nucleotidyltransferase domain-containing protein [bacterium]